MVERCVLERCDGNGIMLSGYNNNTNISGNTIVQTGATAIALWGNTTGTHPDQPPGTGPDGTGGNFPQNTLVASNFIHQLGIHAKQSACFFQAKSAKTTLRNNICFDVPRAGFNFNDGFGGGNVVNHNILFQTCGESGDHGAINTWDRQAFITTVATGQPSFVPAVTEIAHNFIVSDGDADGGAVDNDDGSSHYNLHHNFAVYGGAKINNIGGHAQAVHSNVYAYPSVYGPSCLWVGQFAKLGQEPRMYNNTCVLNPGDHYLSLQGRCFFGYPDTFAPYIRTGNNTVYVQNRSESKGLVSGCLRPPPRPPRPRPIASCSQVFANTTTAMSYENDMYGEYGMPAQTPAECRARCAGYTNCSAGEWYLSEIYPGPTQPGTPPRDQTGLCYLFHEPAVAGPAAALGKTPGHYSFNCTGGVTPYVPWADSGLDYDAWMAHGVDKGTTIEDAPPVDGVIRMGMRVLLAGTPSGGRPL